MKYWPTCRCAECLKIHFSLGEKASDFRARPILGELLYLYYARKYAGLYAGMHNRLIPTVHEARRQCGEVCSLAADRVSYAEIPAPKIPEERKGTEIGGSIHDRFLRQLAKDQHD